MVSRLGIRQFGIADYVQLEDDFFQKMGIWTLTSNCMKNLAKKSSEGLFGMNFAIIIFILRKKATDIKILILKHFYKKSMGFAMRQNLKKKRQVTISTVVRNVGNSIPENV